MPTAPTQLSVRLSVLLTTVCIISLLIGGAAEAEAPPGPTVEYVVVMGDTLWDLASGRTEPGKDVRVTVAEIIELSGLKESVIRPGQVLQLPVD